MTADDVTELLREMRHQAGITQGELGRRLGWYVHRHQPNTCGVVSRYEHGRRIPKLELVGRWAAACGFTAELVVTRRGSSVWGARVVPLNSDSEVRR